MHIESLELCYKMYVTLKEFRIVDGKIPSICAFQVCLHLLPNNA